MLGLAFSLCLAMELRAEESMRFSAEPKKCLGLGTKEAVAMALWVLFYGSKKCATARSRSVGNGAKSVHQEFDCASATLSIREGTHGPEFGLIRLRPKLNLARAPPRYCCYRCFFILFFIFLYKRY